MPALVLTPHQVEIVRQPIRASIFLEGPAGCGKTTAAVERMLALLSGGFSPDQLLILAPQRSLLAPFQARLRESALAPGGLPDLLTVNGLAQRLIELFWPLVASEAGFALPDQPPTFLTIETAQYYMAHLVRPLLDQGYFESVSIDRNRLYSQILDNLNKAALAGFPHTEIGERLSAAWKGESAQRRVYQDVQACADRFRDYCLGHNLLDFSLQMELLAGTLWQSEPCRTYLTERYSGLIYDSIEEDTPLAHDLIAGLLPRLDSSMLVMDWDAGYRRYLGADPEDACRLKLPGAEVRALTGPLVSPPELQHIGWELGRALKRRSEDHPGLRDAAPGNLKEALHIRATRYNPEMVETVADAIDGLVGSGQAAPGEIAVLPPYLGDALRYSLVSSLTRRGIPVRTRRPSRSLKGEPAVRCLLTLARLAHPRWQLDPYPEEVTLAMMQAIGELDLVRSHLLATATYRSVSGSFSWADFEAVDQPRRSRITYQTGERYRRLHDWLTAWHDCPEIELDVFLSRLFGEVLSQPGYGFWRNDEAGSAAAALIDSVRKFRWEVGPALLKEGIPIAPEYVRMVEDGVISAQYLRRWQEAPGDAVEIAPAHTFLMENRPVEFQFWLDAGSRGWWERLNQPLTHPYVLSRAWAPGAVWTDLDEVEANQEALFRLCLGLLRRCRRGVYLAYSELGMQGFEQRGPLLDAFQHLLRGEAWGGGRV